MTRSHGDHHLRRWDGRHVNGSVDTIPFAVLLALPSYLAPVPTVPCSWLPRGMCAVLIWLA